MAAKKNSKTKEFTPNPIVKEEEKPVVVKEEPKPMKTVHPTCLVNVREKPYIGATILRVIDVNNSEVVKREVNDWYEFVDGGFSMMKYYE